MNRPGKPADVATTNVAPQSVRDVAVQAKRKVTYVFNTSATGGSVKIPYCVDVDGTIVSGATKPGRLLHNTAVHVLVDQGSVVSLYLNSDAHPDYRKEPVYKVTAGERDIKVTVTEKTGLLTDTDTPVFAKTDGAKGKEVDQYTARLTGDIWMKVSHKYTRAEAEVLLPASADSGVKTAVLAVYDVLTTKTLSIACADPAGHAITVSFEDSNNPKDNINNYELKRDGLPRIHPQGLFALFDAARKSSVTKLTMSSCWRPLLGSIAHRAGLGLDVSYLEDANDKVSVNRQELRKGKDVEWVSEEEKRLFGVYETSKKTASTAAATLKTADQALAQGTKAKAENLQDLTTARDTAKQAKADADKAVVDAKAAWATERDAREPGAIRSFRTALAADTHVGQLFDPWFMDDNTRDKVAAKPNEQVSKNETLHAHHLHITVRDANIL